MAYSTITDIYNYLEEEELVLLTNDRDTNAITTLSSDTTEGFNHIYLTSSDEFPSSNGRVKIDDEEIDYISNSYNTLSGLTRGVNNTVEANHLSGSTITEIHKVIDSVVSRCISDADAEIDTYLGTKFSDLPLSSVPNVIRKTSVDITIYNLYSRRLSIPPQIETRYNNAIKFLQRVLEGKISLGDSTVEATQDGRISTNTYEDDKQFTIGSVVLGTTGTLDDF